MTGIASISQKELLEVALNEIPKSANVAAAASSTALAAATGKTPVIVSGVLTADGAAVATITDSDDVAIAYFHLVAGVPVEIKAPILGRSGKGIKVAATTNKVAYVLNIADNVAVMGS